MRRTLPMLPTLAAALCACASLCVHAQESSAFMASVLTPDADVSGGLEVHGSVARLVSNATVSATDHTALVTLARGGKVLVCSTSSLHLLRSGTDGALLFGLDRGALEIQSTTRPQDTILTPDLRFTLRTAGQLDLKLRVTREGDTCVDNRGAGAPVLQVSEAFGAATYYIAPGQHLLFERGSVRAVVDKERSECGCPAASPAPVAIAGNATSAASPAQAAAMHPFPTAQSADLAPANPTVPLPASPASLPSDATLSYSPAKIAEASADAAAPAVAPRANAPAVPASTVVPAQTAAAEPPPSPPGARAIAHAIGGFFHRIFHRKAS